MIDAICDICGKQTCEPHELVIRNMPYDFCIGNHEGFHRVLCEDCAQALIYHVEVCTTMYRRRREEFCTFLKNRNGKDETE